MYATTIAQLTLLSLATVFALDDEDHVEVVTFHGVVETPYPSTGQPTRPCLIRVRVDAKTFAGIDLGGADPSVSLNRLSALVSPNPAAYVPVQSAG